MTRHLTALHLKTVHGDKNTTGFQSFWTVLLHQHTFSIPSLLHILGSKHEDASGFLNTMLSGLVKRSKPSFSARLFHSYLSIFLISIYDWFFNMHKRIDGLVCGKFLSKYTAKLQTNHKQSLVMNTSVQLDIGQCYQPCLKYSIQQAILLPSH